MVDFVVSVEYQDNLSAGMNAATASLNSAAAAADKLDTTVTRVGPSATALARRYDDVTSSAVKLQAAQDKLAASIATMDAGVANGTVTVTQRNSVVDSLSSKVQALSAATANSVPITNQMTTAQGAAAAAADGLTSSHGQTAFATRQLGVQMTQLFSGIATGQPVMMSLIQQGHQVGDVMLSTGVGVKGMVGAIADMISPTVAVVAGVAAFAAGVYLLGSAAESTQSQMLSMQAALRSTRDDYVSMAAEATAVAKAVSAASGFNTSDSRQAAQSFAAVPTFTGNQQQLQALVLTAGDLATVMGVTLPVAAQKLAVAMQDPAKLAQDWANSQSFGMTQAMADNIKTMQEGGDKAGAFAADLDALKSKTQGAAEASKTELQIAMENLGKAFTSTGADGKSFADILGGYVVDAATSALNVITGIVNGISAVRVAINTPASAPSQSVLTNPVSGTQGIFQLAPATAAGLGVNAADANQNIVGGLTYLQQLQQQYSGTTGTNGALAQYGGYGHDTAAAVGYINKVNSADTSVLNSSTVMNGSQTMTTAQAIQFWGESLGLDQATINLGMRVATVESHGQQFGGAQAAAGAANGDLSDMSLPIPPIPPAATGDANGVSNSSLVSDALARIGGSTTTGVATSSAANIKDDIAALAQLASQGDTTSLSVQKLNEDLQKQQLAFQNAIQPAQALLDTTSRQTVGEDDITAAYADGMAAVDHMTNSVKAEQMARQFAQAGTAQYTAIVDALTAAYDKSTKSMQTRQAESQNVDNKQQLDYLNAELSTLTESSTVRATDLAVMKEKQDIQKNMPDLDQAEQDKLIANAAAIANATTQLQTQQAAISEIGSALTNVANQLGQAISDSFLSGTGAAVNWGNVTKAVIASVLQELVKLAVINPLMNAVLGTNSTTLGGVISVLGSSGGTTTTSASGSNLLSNGSSAVSLIGGANTLSGGSLFSALGLTGPGGLTESLGLSGSNSIFSGIGSSASSFLATDTGLGATGLGGIPAEGAYSAGEVAASGSAGASIGSLASGVGIGFAAGSLLGGGIQSLTNKTGPGPEIGAAGGAIAGAVIGSVVPVIGTILGGLIGGVVGGAGGGLIGPAPASTYGGVSLAVGSDGLLQAGISSSQGNAGITADQAVATQNIDSVNAFLTSHGLKIASAGTNGTGVIANSNTPGNANPGGVSWIGSATTPGDPNFFSDLDTPNDTTGKSLFSGFQFSSADPLLNADISGKSFANTAALVSEVTAFQAAEAAISTLLTTVVPALTTTAVNTGTLTASLEATAQPYDQAIAAAKLLLTTNAATTDQTNQLIQSETDLTTARDKATAAVIASVAATYDQIDKTTAGASLSAYATITGNPADQETADLYTFDNSAAQQEASFKAQLIATYGDSVVTTQGYADQMTALENSLGLQRLAIQTQYNEKLVATAQTGVSSLAAEVTKLQTGSASPLSPSAQYSLASNQFNAVAGAAQAGDWNSYQNISTYADSLLSASQAYNGSGSAYVADYSRVLGTLSSLASETPDQLTASIYTVQMQTQTQILSAGLDSLRAQVASLQTALVQANGMPTRVSGWSK